MLGMDGCFTDDRQDNRPQLIPQFALTAPIIMFVSQSQPVKSRKMYLSCLTPLMSRKIEWD